MERYRRILATALVGIAAVFAAAFLATPAQAESQSRMGPDQVERTDGVLDCTGMLQIWNYKVTRLRILACTAGAIPYPSHAAAFAVCSTGLVLTGVGGGVASLACLEAAL